METFPNRNLIQRHQTERLRELIRELLPGNRFYQDKLGGNVQSDSVTLRAFKEFSFTSKAELVRDQAQHPPYGSVLTFPLDRYVKVHRTSGTTGAPMYWLDTEESWDWFTDCWADVFRAAGVRSEDRIFFAFSFGPFVGFWSGWDGARKVGALAVSGGGQSTQQRLQAILDYRATVVVCTPTYALHMAAEADKLGLDLAKGSEVKRVVVAGEPGANIPSTKYRIEAAWGAKCYDHTGATEVGAWGYECEPQPGGVHVNENEFIAEVVNPDTGQDVAEGERGELILTNLGRLGSPVIRYRTGDLVQPSYRPCRCGRSFVFLEGGVLGRVDDMVVVRGINVYPSAVEGILRGFPEIEEYRVDVLASEGLSEIKLTLEPRPGLTSTTELVAKAEDGVRNGLGLRVTVECVPPNTLPRFELKARRFFKG
ncbi:MAG: AMP-binding protein [Deltaproteobacteria bacterium]|nr:AMP-binding protein [Deltaproteobacteria bacterium]